MGINIENQNNGSRVRLSGGITIYAANQLMEQLLNLIHNNKSLEIDFDEVTEFDSAGIQLLVAVKREAAALNQAIHFSKHSTAVLEVLNLYDLNEMFDAHRPPPTYY